MPEFQREYVWPKKKVLELFDSIYREFPIGSFFLWIAGRQHNHLFLELVDLGIPPVGSTMILLHSTASSVSCPLLRPSMGSPSTAPTTGTSSST